MTHPYYDKRNATIYKMRVEEKKTLEEIGNQFDLCKESIRYIVAKQERANAEEEERRAAPPDTIGAMRISTRLKNFLANEDFYGPDTVIYFLQTVSMKEMMRTPNYGKKTLKELTDEAEKIVGADVVRRWLDGRL
jgi:DNA-directed RNA polymerase alpha subunit